MVVLDVVRVSRCFSRRRRQLSGEHALDGLVYGMEVAAPVAGPSESGAAHNAANWDRGVRNAW